MKKILKLLVLACFAAWMITFNGCKKDAEVPPITALSITTAAISGMTTTSVETGGNVISSGEADILNKISSLKILFYYFSR